MTELEFQFLARPEPSAIISGNPERGEAFLAILASLREIVLGST